jgi:selenoprotein W-related protein
MSNVVITYCRPCGYETRAKIAAAELQKCVGVAATLRPGTGGIFEVAVDGTVVARRTKGHFPDAAAIVAAVSRANH